MSKLKLETIAQGIKCDITGADSYVIQNSREWETLLSKMFYGQERYLEYDFRRYTVVGVFLGTSIPRSAIKIQTAYEKRNKVYVDVVRNVVIGTNSNILDKYSPYHIVSIPKRSCSIEFQFTEDSSLLASGRSKR